MTAEKGFKRKLREIFPRVICAGDDAGVLTDEGALFLDSTGILQAGIPMAAPEGDAGTGMVPLTLFGSTRVMCQPVLLILLWW